MKAATFCFVANICFFSFCNAETSKNGSSFIVAPVGEEGFAALLQFLDYDRGVPLEARTIAKEDLETVVREKIVFTGVNGNRVPGLLAIPQDHPGPHPIVLLLHGLGQTKEEWWEDSGFEVSKRLIAQGFAVLALDAQYHGERRLNNDFDHPWNLLTTHQGIRYRDMVLQSVVEYRKAVDYLATRAEIDTSRIGVMGYSMGAGMTFMLVASESRIKVGIACVCVPAGVTALRRFVYENATDDQLQEIAQTLQTRTEATHAQNYAKGVGSRPFLMIAAARDEFYTIEEARQLYDLIPSPVKELKVFDSGHSLPPEYALKVAQWFELYLK